MMIKNDRPYYPPIPALDLSADTYVVTPGTKVFSLDGNGHVIGGTELDILADHLSGDVDLGLLD